MFIAAALDYEIVNGNQYGALVHEVADSVKKKRRIAAGLEKPRDPLPMPLAPPQLLAKLRKDTEGGIVIVGRHTFKEYMEGLKRGWSESMSSVSVEEQVLSTLNDDVFDEIPIQQSDDPTSRPEPKVEALHLPTSIPKNTSSPLSSLHPFKQSSLSVQQPSPPLVIDAPPAFIPSSPPIGLVPFTNHLGFRQAPYMVYDFFTQRHRVLSGCKAGYAIVLAQTRPMTPYSRSDTPSDLNFDTESEQYIKSSFDKLPKRIADAKKEYYKGLQKRVKTARELAYGEREPTRAERANPPMTEVEIRAERLKKEVKWKEDLSGWEVLRNDVQWDDRFEGVLQVYIDPEPTL
jgi:import inner membrane translocase subunit TIM54